MRWAEPPPKLTPEPAESVPTAAQQRQRWDRLRLELLTDDLDPEAIEAARQDPAAPTDAELREQAKALGLPVPPPRKGTRERFRSGLDPTAVQLVKDLNAAYDRAGAIHRKANLPASKIASLEVR